jgi:hypothetical protein
VPHAKYGLIWFFIYNMMYGGLEMVCSENLPIWLYPEFCVFRWAPIFFSGTDPVVPDIVSLLRSQRRRPDRQDPGMAPVTRRRKKALATAPPAPALDPADRLSKLPDEILAQILSFLPAQEAVRTCVLERTWRDVWKTTKRLLITGNGT